MDITIETKIKIIRLFADYETLLEIRVVNLFRGQKGCIKTNRGFPSNYNTYFSYF